jgi:glycosyltransferase involved in cell wall biosynthesis
MSSLSMVIPCYTINDDLKEMVIQAAASYRDQVDELIIVEDGGQFVSEFAEIADVYMYFKENKGFTVNVNRGWRVAKGDYTAIASSDTMLVEGNLKHLCIPGKVTSPEITNQHIDFLAGPFFVVPKTVRDERGYLREEMRTYSSDSEYDHRVRDMFQKVPSVRVFHQMMQTVRAAGVEGGEEQQRDREAYQRLREAGEAL